MFSGIVPHLAIFVSRGSYSVRRSNPLVCVDPREKQIVFARAGRYLCGTALALSPCCGGLGSLDRIRLFCLQQVSYNGKHSTPLSVLLIVCCTVCFCSRRFRGRLCVCVPPSVSPSYAFPAEPAPRLHLSSTDNWYVFAVFL